MNLYIFNQSSPAAIFGVGTYIRELTAALRNSFINVCVVNLKSEKRQIQTEDVDGIRHWYFPAPATEPNATDYKVQRDLYYSNIVYLLRLYIEDKKDLVFHLNYNQSGKLAEELQKAFDCRIVAAIHYLEGCVILSGNLTQFRNIIASQETSGGDMLNKLVRESFLKEKKLFEIADRVICLSDYMSEILCRDYGLDAEKISVISNGLTEQGFRGIADQVRNDRVSQEIADQVRNDRVSQEIADQVRNDKDVKNLRAKWNLSPKEKIILFAGRLDAVKGLVFLIKAFREVLEKYPDCRLMIAGSSGNYDTFFQEAKDICTKITFTGLLKKEDLYALYQIADAGIVPSLFETFGYVAVEMMMHGLPLVATATSGLNEVIDESCGLKVPITVLPDKVEIDTNILAEKIVYLLQHPDEAKKMGQNGRKRYLKEYTSEVFRRNMLDFYRLLSESKIQGSSKKKPAKNNKYPANDIPALQSTAIYPNFLIKAENYISRLRQINSFSLNYSGGEWICFVEGLEFILNSEEELLILQEVFVDGIYNVDIGKPFTFIDIGMNVGIVSLFFAKKDECKKVVAFEPFQRTLSFAKKNFERNQISQKIQVNETGLGYPPRTLKVDYSEKSKGCAGINGLAPHIEDMEDVSEEQLIITDVFEALKDIVDEKVILKIDCEGSEYEILERLNDTGILSRFDVIMLEWHFKGNVALRKILLDNNFEILSTGDHNLNAGMLYAFKK